MEASDARMVRFLRKVIDLSADGLMVVDRDGVIVYINDSFKEVHGLEEKDAIGRHVTDVIENTRLHIVAQTGVAEHDDFQDISDNRYVVSRIPIIEEGRSVGAIGLIRFRYVEEVQRLTGEVRALTDKINDMRETRRVSADTEFSFDDVPGTAPAVARAKEISMQAAPTAVPVLLRGEPGAGKERFAQSIHNAGPRRQGPFIRLNCAAIRPERVEQELFGGGGRKGKIGLAQGGTLFLDEVADLPPDAQARLLRVLRETPEAGEATDVRIVAATSRDLEELVREGAFRKDLFYRLNVIPVRIPALREAPEEIAPLAKLIWARLSRRHGVFHKRLTSKALKALERHHWQGNVRELANVLERALIVCRHDHIEEADIQRILIQSGARADLTDPGFEEGKFSLHEIVKQTERRAVRYALAAAEGNRARAARILGISRPLLYKKIARYGLE